MNKNLLVNFLVMVALSNSDWLAKSNGNFDYYQFNSYQELKMVLKRTTIKQLFLATTILIYISYY